MASGLVYENLTKLRLLGIIELVDAGEPSVDEKIEYVAEMREKTSAYIRVAQMKDDFRKLSTKLPAV